MSKIQDWVKDCEENPSPEPWTWQGEDYRGGWGWMMLVDGNGAGIIIGQGDDGMAAPGLQTGMPADPEKCITGLAAGDKPRFNCVHVFKPANARLIRDAAKNKRERDELMKMLAWICKEDDLKRVKKASYDLLRMLNEYKNKGD